MSDDLGTDLVRAVEHVHDNTRFAARALNGGDGTTGREEQHCDSEHRAERCQGGAQSCPDQPTVLVRTAVNPVVITPGLA